MRKYFPLIAVSIISGFFIFYRLGSTHLLEWDEAIYASVTKNILQSGEWLTLFYNKARWYQKPPLYIWLTVPMLKIFGITSFAARFWSAFFGLAGIVTTYFLAKELFPKAKFTPFLSAIFLLTNFQYLYYSRMGMLDVSVTFFIALSFLFFFKSRENSKYFLLSSVTMALAVMTKSVVGLFAPLIIFLYFIFHLFLFRKIPPEFHQHWKFYIGAFLSFLLIVLPWHLYSLITYHYDFFREYFLYHIGSRALRGIEAHSRPRFWYIEVIHYSLKIFFYLLFPAILFQISLVIQSIFSTWKNDVLPAVSEETDPKLSSSLLFLFIWFILIFGFFTASQSKLIWYIIPLYPSLALILGQFYGTGLNLFVKKFSVFSKYNFLIFAGLFFLTITYLFYLRDKIYTKDFSGPASQLIELKNKIASGPLIISVQGGITQAVASFYNEGYVYSTVPAEVPGRLEQGLASFALVEKEVYQKLLINEWLKSKGVKLQVIGEKENIILLQIKK